MKKIWLSAAALAVLTIASCSNDGDSDDTTIKDSAMVQDNMMETGTTMTSTTEYIDLNTGAPVRKDEATGKYVGNDNNPVEYYVIMSTHDTIYAPTGQKMNYAMVHDNSGKWSFDKSKIEIQNDGDIKMKDDDRKVKIDKDGDIKFKDKSGTTKIDADDGNVKIK